MVVLFVSSGVPRMGTGQVYHELMLDLCWVFVRYQDMVLPSVEEKSYIMSICICSVY